MVELLKLIATTLTLFHFLGPWGALALVAAIVALGAGLYANGDRLLEWFIHGNARAIGKVMKGATVTVHSVTPAPEPDPSVWRTGDDEEDDAFEEALEASEMPDGDFAWFKVDATIDPRPDAQGGPAAWEPGMVHLRKNDGESPHPLEFDTDCLIAQVEHWTGGEFVVFEHGMLNGSGRIRLYAGIVPGINALQFSYLGATFGEVQFPASRLAIRPSSGSRARTPGTEVRR